jgi:hypothetical protein
MRMSRLHETAYPVLLAEVGKGERPAIFTLISAEIRFVYRLFRQTPTRARTLTQLKLLQRLGYLPLVSDVPAEIIQHVCPYSAHVRCRALLPVGQQVAPSGDSARVRQHPDH